MGQLSVSVIVVPPWWTLHHVLSPVIASNPAFLCLLPQCFRADDLYRMAVFALVMSHLSMFTFTNPRTGGVRFS